MRSKEILKQFLKMYNKPIIIHTLEHFENNKNIDVIVVACNSEWIDYLKKLLCKFRLEKVKTFVPGGATGWLLIYNGLIVAKESCKNTKSVVLIRDSSQRTIVAPFLVIM